MSDQQPKCEFGSDDDIDAPVINDECDSDAGSDTDAPINDEPLLDESDKKNIINNDEIPYIEITDAVLNFAHLQTYMTNVLHTYYKDDDCYSKYPMGHLLNHLSKLCKKLNKNECKTLIARLMGLTQRVKNLDNMKVASNNLDRVRDIENMDKLLDSSKYNPPKKYVSNVVANGFKFNPHATEYTTKTETETKEPTANAQRKSKPTTHKKPATNTQQKQNSKGNVVPLVLTETKVTITEKPIVTTTEKKDVTSPSPQVTNILSDDEVNKIIREKYPYITDNGMIARIKQSILSK